MWPSLWALFSVICANPTLCWHTELCYCTLDPAKPGGVQLPFPSSPSLAGNSSHRDTEGAGAGHGGGRGPPNPVINYYLIRAAGSAHQIKALCLLPAHLCFPSVEQNPSGLPLAAGGDFGTDGTSLFRVTQNNKAEPGRGMCPAHRGASMARGARWAGSSVPGCRGNWLLQQDRLYPLGRFPQPREAGAAGGAPGEREACPHLGACLQCSPGAPRCDKGVTKAKRTPRTQGTLGVPNKPNDPKMVGDGRALKG